MHQAILPSTHTSLTGISTPHLDYGISAILLWLLPSSFFEGLLLFLISEGNFLTLRSCNLGPLSTLQQGNILYYHLILELLEVLQPFLLLLLFCKPLSFSFFLCLGLHLSSCLLGCMLYMTGLCYLFQMN